MDKPTMEFKTTTQEIIDDLHYHQAQAIAEDFLAQGLINQSQFEEIEKLNRQSFPPLLAELMA